jgi:ribosomal protein S18 acetylase RimI-like enzyme
MNYRIRQIEKMDYPVLENFLYEAIFIPAGTEPPPKTILASPELQVYIDRFGEEKDDWGFLAEAEGKIIGAVWVRIMNDYGHIDDQTPSLAISLYKEYRGIGIGSALIQEMLMFLKRQGCPRVSLSVQKANPAVKLYQRMGFEIMRSSDEEYIMVCRLQPGSNL